MFILTFNKNLNNKKGAPIFDLGLGFMASIRDWATYTPSNTAEVDGRKVPSPAIDEDEITMAYEVLSRINLTPNTHLIFVADTNNHPPDFHVVPELLGMGGLKVTVLNSLDDGIEQAIRSVPSVMVVVRGEPPAASVAIEFHKKGKVDVLKHEVRKEFMGFMRTSLTDERALSDLLSEITLSSLPRIIKKLFRGRSKMSSIKVVSGYMSKPKILEKTIASLKLKSADLSPVKEVLKAGFKGHIAAALSLVKGLERCCSIGRTKMLFIGEATGGGVYVVVMRCKSK